MLSTPLNPDISPNFKPNAIDSKIIQAVIRHEGTPRAIATFSELHRHLTDYAYWFLLGTLWVSYSGRSDLELWRKLFRVGRSRRASSLMKPSELSAFLALPSTLQVYRAHRPQETDWISYTLDRHTAERFANERGGVIKRYAVRKRHALALFLRRAEQEIIVLDPLNAVPVADSIKIPYGFFGVKRDSEKASDH